MPAAEIPLEARDGHDAIPSAHDCTGRAASDCPAADPTATYWAAFRDAGLDGLHQGVRGGGMRFLGVVDEDEQVIGAGQFRCPLYRVRCDIPRRVERHR
jgi:hypothetical protein